MNTYRDTIAKAVPGRSEADYAEIEEIMRKDIFHSTLDWQTEEQLMDAAREAAEMMAALRMWRAYRRYTALQALRQGRSHVRLKRSR